MTDSDTTDSARTDGAAVADWIGRYETAWDSNDPEDVRALFAPDAEYRFAPQEDPFVGHDAIVAEWLERRDESGDHTFTWRPVAIDGATAVIQARTVYRGGSAAGRDYDNLWVVELAPDGRATAFTEWYMERDAGG